MPVKLPLEARDIPARGADFELIRELAALLDETGLTEIEIGAGEARIRIAKAAAPALPQAPAEAPPAAPATPDASHPGAVTSPLVGVLYLAPEPGARRFVEIGDQVSEGETLFIVEAMKTMNMIRAPRSGRVARILVENGAPVEYGEVLLILE